MCIEYSCRLVAYSSCAGDWDCDPGDEGWGL